MSKDVKEFLATLGYDVYVNTSNTTGYKKGVK